MKRPLMLTFTGRHVNPLDVQPEDICAEDIAHHLACINRFNGAVHTPITVAQHTVYVSRLLEGTGYEWDGLHHDDAEAYMGDMTKWLKESDAMAAFREAEDKAQRACYTFFGIPPSHYEGYPKLMAPPVLEADKLMVRFEGLRGFGTIRWKRWSELLAGYPMLSGEELRRVGKWAPWSWKAAKEAWLTRYRILRERRALAEGSGNRPG
jgi:hypothetical protein